ncbi:flavodoxin family protein [Methanofollis sp. UBA420]|jgi:multimeric flavodoxin WrbA|uniref:flavodoxin family protein n=1 Tax=Methanofollis sp. UBA420 TaxID=1915514 RepID=UPI00316ACCA7
MKVLGVSGSMRKDGNTAQLVRYILAKVQMSGIETEFVSLAGRIVHPCTGCERCKETKWCVIEGDGWGDIAQRMLEAEVVVIGSPTYYYDVNGQMKNLIDRTYSLYHDRKLAGRNAVAVTVCADRGCERSLETIEGFLNTHQFSYLGHVCGKAYLPGEIMTDARAVKKADGVAKKIVNLLQPKD